jgi:LacI family transcriptional regulator, fructose operon transcriptional repressor
MTGSDGPMRAPRMRKPTIYDIAAATGASASTVSAVLNGSWKQRRIREETATQIRRAASEAGYSANLQARGLRKSRSGLIGMIVPTHEDRFFASLGHHFELEARRRDLCPVIVSTLRDPVEEARTVETLIQFNVESIVITGATEPDALGHLCAQAGIRHINVDLPGRLATSVVSDNYWGAKQLTETLIRKSGLAAAKAGGEARRGHVQFLGGIASDHATANRIRGFREVHEALIGPVSETQIRASSYDPNVNERLIRALHQAEGGLPPALFVNSTIAFEGAIRFLKTLPDEAFAGCVVGCYDWDPFASFLHFPVTMVRQNTEGLMAEAFRQLEGVADQSARLIEIRPELVAF